MDFVTTVEVMTATPAEATLSEFLREPTATVARLQDNVRKGMTLHRRDGEDLYLTTAERAAAVSEVVGSHTAIFVALMKTDPNAVDTLTRVFPEAFPWVRWLPADGVREFLVEYIETARAAAELGTVGPLAPVVASWKATAEVYSDPDLYAKLRSKTDGEDFGPAEPPAAE